MGAGPPVRSGTVEVTLETPGAPTVLQRVELRSGERKTIDISPQGSTTGPAIITPPRPRSSGGGTGVLLPMAIAFGGVGVVGMGMFGVAGGLSLSTYSEVEDKCPADPTCNDLIDRGEKEQLIANVGAVIGGVGLAAGATLLIVELATGGGSSSRREAALPVDVAVGPGYVGISGKF